MITLRITFINGNVEDLSFDASRLEMASVSWSHVLGHIKSAEIVAYEPVRIIEGMFHAC